jgi:ABC-type uncharacterized transport system permease subunit
MLDMIHLFNWLLPLFYAVSFGLYLAAFIRAKGQLTNVKRVSLFITLLIHGIYLLLRTIEFQHAPITTKFEVFTVLAFAISFSYFILELITDVRGTGAFIIFFSLIFQILSSLFIEDLLVVNEILRNRFLGLHVISALLGYSGFTISAVYGILFFMLYKNLKNQKYGFLFERLPSLEVLEKMSFYAVLIGFTMLTIAIVIGVIWLPDAFPDFSYLDPKIVTTGIVWLVYTGGILTKKILRLYGKKVILFSIFGFVFALLSFVITGIVQSTFHSFN